MPNIDVSKKKQQAPIEIFLTRIVKEAGTPTSKTEANSKSPSIFDGLTRVVSLSLKLKTDCYTLALCVM